MKQIEKAYVFRLYPTEQQEILISKTIGSARFVYNFFLDQRTEFYAATMQSFSYGDCSALLTKFKRERDLIWLKDVDKFALQNALKDLNTAFVNFFRERANGNKKQGYPKFHKKHDQ